MRLHVLPKLGRKRPANLTKRDVLGVLGELQHARTLRRRRGCG